MTEYPTQGGTMDEGLFARLSRRAARVAAPQRRCEGECVSLLDEKKWFVGSSRVCRLCQAARALKKQQEAIERVEAERDRLIRQRRTEQETTRQVEERARAAAGDRDA